VDGFNATRNIRLMYAVTFIVRLQPWFVVWITYLTDFRDFSLAQVGLLETFFWGIIIATEVPTGAFSDRYGRRVTFLVALTLEGLGLAVFAFATNYPVLLASYVLWAAGIAFWQGNVSAYIFDALAAEGREDEFTSRFGRNSALMDASSMIGGLIGGLIASAITLQAPVLLNVPLMLAGLLFVFFMREPPSRRTSERPSYAQTVVGAARAIRRAPEIGLLILLGASLAVSHVAGIMLMQPFLRAHAVPLAIWGVLLVPHGLVNIAGSLGADRVGRALGLRTTLAVSGVVRIAALLALGLTGHVAAFGGFYLIAGFGSLLNPLANAYINERVDEDVRATVLSVDSMGFSTMFAIGAPVAGIIADRSLDGAFVTIAAAMAVLSVPAYALWLRADRASVARRAVTELEAAGD
jgi:MFS family permease